MKTFTIDKDNNITVFASLKAVPKAEGTEIFATGKALAELAAGWPASRLVELWNSIPGVMPVRKFKDRGTALNRIWKAVQTFAESAPLANEVPEPETPFDTATAPRKHGVGRAKASARGSACRERRASKGTSHAGAPREGSKSSKVIAMLRREGGTTLEEIMRETGWQQHTTRALLSAGGALRKKHGVLVMSTIIGDERRYSAKA